MKKLFAVAAMAVTFCLAGLVMSGTALAQQCVDNGDGTVTDSGMGLMWQKATAGDMPHQNARNYTESLVLSGHDDWYLPSSDNLVKLFQSSPCRNLMTLPSFWYWSSSGYFYGGVPGYYRVHPSQGIALEYSLSYSFEVLAVRRAR